MSVVDDTRHMPNVRLAAYNMKCDNDGYHCILHFTFLFSLFVFVGAAGHYFRIWTGQVPALLF